MITLLDVTLSVITGTIVILTIVFSIININQMNYNLETMLTLHKHAANVIYWLDLYLEPAGRYIANTATGTPPTPQPTFLEATEHRLRFNSIENFYDTITQMREYDFIHVNTGGEPRIEVRIGPSGGPTTEVYRTYPATLQEPVYTYFDSLLTVINPTNTPAQMARIRSVRVDLILSAPGWTNNPDHATIFYPITFWKYFKNVYIANAP